MNLSRRAALRAGGGLVAAAGLAGCVEQRVTKRTTEVESSTHWALSPDVSESLSASEFDTYVDEMKDRYGDSGVWGRESEQPDNFETAYVQQFAIKRDTPGDPGGTKASLRPGDVDPDAPLLFTDASVAIYSVGENRYRYWLWAAADANDSRLVRDIRLGALSAGVRPQAGPIADAAKPSTSGDEATVSLGTPPTATFPLRDGSLGTTTIRGEDGTYRVNWAGDVNGVQSVNGVCEEERTSAHEFFWTLSAGYRFETTE
ncbi:MAG: hypothetical protein ACI8UR_002017 [Natronomonas sp.]|jgi:hypothetical protein|uniref:hypothetical protein n=1 Tax=Natronomonas sp. TaxID=2184060 RepID=UPI0039892738